MKPNILFLPSNNYNFIEMHRLAKYLIHKYLATPFMILTNADVASFRQKFDNDGIVFIDQNNRLLEKLQKRLLKSFDNYDNVVFKERIQIKYLSLFLKNRKRNLKYFLGKINPRSVILKGDHHWGNGWEPASD